MKKMNLNRKFNSGFTLIELLVVVAIIFILSKLVLALLDKSICKGDPEREGCKEKIENKQPVKN